MPTWTLLAPTDLPSLDFLTLELPALPEIHTSTHLRRVAGNLSLDLIGHGFLYDGDNLLPFGRIEELRLGDGVQALLDVAELVWDVLEVLSYYNPLTDRWDKQGLRDYLFSRADECIGSAGDDTLCGRGGDDLLVGNGGIDTAEYAGARSRYTVTHADEGWRVADVTGAEGRDTLVGVERLRFADGALALDLDGHAGDVARLVSALFGAEALGRGDLVGAGLALLDGGMGLAELAALAAGSPWFAEAAGGASDAAFVEAVYRHATGQAPTAAERGHYLGLLDSGAQSRASLALLAAGTAEVATAIDLVGLADHGLPFTPAG